MQIMKKIRAKFKTLWEESCYFCDKTISANKDPLGIKILIGRSDKERKLAKNPLFEYNGVPNEIYVCEEHRLKLEKYIAFLKDEITPSEFKLFVKQSCQNCGETAVCHPFTNEYPIFCKQCADDFEHSVKNLNKSYRKQRKVSHQNIWHRIIKPSLSLFLIIASMLILMRKYFV